MRVFVYCIAADIHAPPEGTGYVRAEAAIERINRALDQREKDRE